MSKRLKLLYLLTLPEAALAVAILEILNLTDSGAAAGAVLITLSLLAFWVVDAPEIGLNRRAGKRARSG